ncbi:MAG TPA: nitrilase-related carbon-nitrogen hydrolase [Myxococcales bacterium]|jgi:predicted amidohydrolase
MRAGFLQFSPVWGEKDENLANIELSLSGLTSDLVVLPELCTTGYQLTREEALFLGEPFPGGPTCDALVRIARKLDSFLVAGVAERDGARVFNSAVLVGPEGHVATYRKAHLFAHETLAFDRADSPFAVHEVRGARVGMMICFDWAFPEVARSLALAGADLIAHPSNLVLPFCQRAMPVRCLENGVFAVTANRVGTEDRLAGRPSLSFTGGSLIAGPRGEILAQAGVSDAAFTFLELDPARARDKRITPLNDLLADRRCDLYRR